MTLNFRTSPADAALIDEIIYRARGYGIHDALNVPAFHLQMTLTAHHNASGGGLNLQSLLDASLVDFAHDILGMHRHIDHETGLMRDCFVPRCGYVKVAEWEVPSVGEGEIGRRAGRT